VRRLFTVISGPTPVSDADLSHLIGLGGIIVVLMGIGTVRQMVVGFTRLGTWDEIPVAIIERRFANGQRATICTLYRVHDVIYEVGGFVFPPPL